jgi:hypothetical protein
LNSFGEVGIGVTTVISQIRVIELRLCPYEVSFTVPSTILLNCPMFFIHV